MIQNPIPGVIRGFETAGEDGIRSMTQAEEIELLKEELREARETLAAIRSGAADALVIVRNGREMVYTLENADKPFRIFFEEMQEGAVTLDRNGLVVYANRRFAGIV